MRIFSKEVEKTREKGWKKKGTSVLDAVKEGPMVCSDPCIESQLFGLCGFESLSSHVVAYFVSIFGPSSQTLRGCAGLPPASRPCLPPLVAPTLVLLVPFIVSVF